MKILCLHGNRSSGETLSKSIKSIKIKNVEFIFITSPFKFDNEESFFKWWTGNLDNIYTNPSYDLIFESIKYVFEAYNNLGPFEGILGFSQGAVLANIILYLQEYSNFFDIKYHNFRFNFKFAVLCSLSIITDLELKKMLQYKINIPVLNVFGENDPILPFNHCESLSQYFSNCINYKHDGKHYVPNNSKFKNLLFDFIKKFID